MNKKIILIKGENNPILRAKSKNIGIKLILDKKTQQLIEDMKITMQESGGIGLAAPQVGYNIRLFLVNTKDGPLTFVNPKIIWKSLRKEEGEEGCLSLPGIWGTVKRHQSIRLVYLNQQGKKQLLKARGMLARIIQHENDHLSGVLFIDRIKN